MRHIQGETFTYGDYYFQEKNKRQLLTGIKPQTSVKLFVKG